MLYCIPHVVILLFSTFERLCLKQRWVILLEKTWLPAYLVLPAWYFKCLYNTFCTIGLAYRLFYQVILFVEIGCNFSEIWAHSNSFTKCVCAWHSTLKLKIWLSDTKGVLSIHFVSVPGGQDLTRFCRHCNQKYRCFLWSLQPTKAMAILWEWHDLLAALWNMQVHMHNHILCYIGSPPIFYCWMLYKDTVYLLHMLCIYYVYMFTGVVFSESYNQWGNTTWWVECGCHIIWDSAKRKSHFQEIQLALHGHRWSSPHQKWKIKGAVCMYSIPMY